MELLVQITDRLRTHKWLIKGLGGISLWMHVDLPKIYFWLVCKGVSHSARDSFQSLRCLNVTLGESNESYGVTINVIRRNTGPCGAACSPLPHPNVSWMQAVAYLKVEGTRFDPSVWLPFYLYVRIWQADTMEVSNICNTANQTASMSYLWGLFQ